MGTDIHGVWEVRVPDGRWFAFRTISDGRSYSWFAIMSGVRGEGPRCDSEEWDPRDSDPGDEVVNNYWREICTRAGYDFHSHTVASVDTVRAANDEYCAERQDRDGPRNKVSSLEYETIPKPDDIVGELWFGIDRDHSVNSLVMGIPLYEVMGLPSDIHGDDERFKSRLRYLCAYDN